MSMDESRQTYFKYNRNNRTRLNWPQMFVDANPAYDFFGPPLSRFRLGQISLLALAVITFPLLGSMPVTASASTLPQMEFTALATRCAPLVPADTLDAVARTESGLDPWALHDNTTGQSEKPENPRLALAQAEHWLGRGDSVDIGLMQINSANLPALGMTAATALDPCSALAGGAAVLRSAYGGGSTSADQQVALLMALSRYNTGTPFKGIMNGYARTVLQNARNPVQPDAVSPTPSSDSIDPSLPQPWNVSATGTYVQAHGASWLIEFSPLVGAKGSFITMGAR